MRVMGALLFAALTLMASAGVVLLLFGGPAPGVLVLLIIVVALAFGWHRGRLRTADLGLALCLLVADMAMIATFAYAFEQCDELVRCDGLGEEATWAWRVLIGVVIAIALLLGYRLLRPPERDARAGG